MPRAKKPEPEASESAPTPSRRERIPRNVPLPAAQQPDPPSSEDVSAALAAAANQEAAETVVSRLPARTPVVKTERENGDVFYVSSGEETNQFDIGLGDVKLRGVWDRTGSRRIIFRVPAAVHERFQSHSFVKSGRIRLVTGVVGDALKAE